MKSIEEQRQTARNTDEVLEYLVNLIELNNKRFSFMWAVGGEKVSMKVYDKEKEIEYVVKIEPIKYDNDGNALNF